MPEHTPGPWYLEWDGGEQRIAKDGIGIARIEPWLGDFAEEQASNAHLLKAAPEILEALEVLVAECTVATESENFALWAAQDAIAKARGGSNES